MFGQEVSSISKILPKGWTSGDQLKLKPKAPFATDSKKKSRSFLQYRDEQNLSEEPKKIEFAFTLTLDRGRSFGVCGRPEAEYGSRCQLYFSEGKFLIWFDLNPNEFQYANQLKERFRDSFRQHQDVWAKYNEPTDESDAYWVESAKVVADDSDQLLPGYLILPYAQIRNLHFGLGTRRIVTASLSSDSDGIIDFGAIAFQGENPHTASYELGPILEDMHRAEGPLPVDRSDTLPKGKVPTWGDLSSEQEGAIRNLVLSLNTKGYHVSPAKGWMHPLQVYSNDRSEAISCFKRAGGGVCRGMVLEGTVGVYVAFEYASLGNWEAIRRRMISRLEEIERKPKSP